MKVRMLTSQYNAVWGGRMQKDDVVDLPDHAAEAWIALGIARKAAASAKTARQLRAERAAQEAEETAATGGQFDTGITRGASPVVEEEQEEETPEEEPATAPRKT